MNFSPETSIDFERLVKSHGYDFLDFGCSKGASLEWACKVLGGFKGLGIDIDSRKVELTVSKGFDACEFDILQIPNIKQVDFVVLSHILENIPDQSIAMRIVPKACHISKKLALTKQSFLTVTIIHSSTA